MRNWSRVAALLLILFGSTICVSISVFSVTPAPPVVPASGTFEKFGARVDCLTFKVYGYSRWLECTELEQGKIDVIDVPVPRYLWEEWLADPEITMGEYTESSVVYFALNNARWPLGHGNQKPAGLDWSHFGGEIAYTDNHNLSLWPKYLESSALDTGGTADTYFFDPNCQRCLDARQFRRALAHLVNRDSIVAHIGGTAMESLVFPAIKEDWENPNIPKYPFNLTQAVETLKNGGFQDYDGDSWVEYSPSHALGWNPGDASPADMEELPSIEVYVGIDDPDRIHVATLLYQMMNHIGIPNKRIITTPSICSLKVWQEYDYDIYPEYSDLGAPNPTIYFEGFHSSRDLYPDPWADNYVHYHSLEFDTYAEDFFTAPTMAEAQSALFEAQAIFHENAVVIPLYTYKGYVAHRTRYGTFPGEMQYAGLNWTGFVNELGLGFHSFWSHLDVHPQGYEKGGVLRQGLIDDVWSFNPVHAYGPHDWLVLSKIYEPLIKNNPYNVTEKIPWLCESFTVGTWEHPTEGTCSAFNFTLLPGILWHDQEFLTAEDVAFTFQFMKDSYSIPFYRNVKELDHVEVVDEYTVAVFYQVQSMWTLDWAGSVPIIPKHIWEGKPSGWSPEDHDAVIGTGPFVAKGDGVLGRPDRVFGDFVYLEEYPSYFRRPIWPDVNGDGIVDISDFMQAVLQFGSFDPIWDPVWGPRCDVNKDGYVSVIDLTEVAVHFGCPWPPPWYVDC